MLCSTSHNKRNTKCHYDFVTVQHSLSKARADCCLVRFLFCLNNKLGCNTCRQCHLCCMFVNRSFHVSEHKMNTAIMWITESSHRYCGRLTSVKIGQRRLCFLLWVSWGHNWPIPVRWREWAQSDSWLQWTWEPAARPATAGGTSLPFFWRRKTTWLYFV